MYRPALRSLATRTIPFARPSHLPRRPLSTAPPAQRTRSWKNRTARLVLAAGAVYYYNTSDVFAEVPAWAMAEPPAADTDAPLPTLASLTPSTRAPKPSPQPTSQTAAEPPTLQTIAEPPTSTTPPPEPSDPSALGAQATTEGAFNEETGEINWDCPCLGGMAHGPCGEEFRAAFSCFVFSTEEPKGMDCIGRFKGMQDCFRAHPDVYGAELDGEDEDGDEDWTAGAEGADGTRPETAAEAADRQAGDEAAGTAGTTAAVGGGRKRDETEKAEPARADDDDDDDTAAAAAAARLAAARERAEIKRQAPEAGAGYLYPETARKAGQQTASADAEKRTGS